MKKRMTAILLAAAMCLSLLPASAFAEEEQSVTVTEEMTAESAAPEETATDETETPAPEETATDETETPAPEETAAEETTTEPPTPAETAAEETTTETPAPEETAAEETTTETAVPAATAAEETGTAATMAATYAGSISSDITISSDTTWSGGGTITGGTDPENPVVITINPDVTFTISGTYVQFGGYVRITGGGTLSVTSVTNVGSESGALCIKSGGHVTFDNVTVDGNDNNSTPTVYLGKANADEKNSVTFTNGAVLKNTKKDVGGWGVSVNVNNNNYIGNSSIILDGVTLNNTSVFTPNYDNIKVTGKVNVLGNVTFNNMINQTSYTGGTVTRDSSFTNGAMFQVGESGTAGTLILNGVTLQGDGETASGKIIEVVNGSVAITSTTIQDFVGSTGTNYMISVDQNNTSSSLTMDSSSKLTGNMVNGTALLGVGNGNTAALTGTSVTGNTVASEGGYLLLAGTVSGSKLTLDGVTVTGNAMSDSGYALRAGTIGNNGATSNVLVKGAAKITDNTTTAGAQHNVYVLTNGKLALDSALTSGASIGVTTADTPKENTPVTVAEGEDYTATITDALCFTSDGGDYLVVCKDSAVKLSIGDDYYVSADGNDSNTGMKDSPFATIQAAYNKITTAGTIHVMSDLSLTTNLSFSEAKTVAIVADKDGDLTTEEQYTITRNSGASGAMLTVSAGDVTLKGVTFDGNGVSLANNNNGILVSGGTLTIGEGAGLTNSVATGMSKYTGGVKVTSGGTVILDGGFITNNQGFDGGGVLAYEGGTFIMNSGEVSGNKARYGGGVYVYGESGYPSAMTLSGGTVTNNYAGTTSGGGGVEVNAHATAVIGSVTVTNNGNVASQAGAGLLIYSNTDSTVTFTGAPVITGNYQGATFADNTVTPGDAAVESNLYLQEGYTVAIGSGGLDSGASIGVTTSVAPTVDAPVTVATGSGYTVTSGDAAAFFSDAAAYQTHFSDGDAPSVVLGTLSDYYVKSSGGSDDNLGTAESPYATIAKAYEMVYPGGTIHVMDDLTLDDNLTVSKSVTILSDSDGNLDDKEQYTITRGTGLTSVTMLTATGEGVDVTLKNIIFDGNKDNVKSINALRVEAGATLTLDAGAVVQNNKTGSGSGEPNDGAVVVNAATLNIRDGAVIQNNETYGRGGGVSTRTDDAVVNMTGGAITGNKNYNGTYPQGGGVYLERGTFNMSGGSITGNSAPFSSGAGGGVYMGSSGTLNVSGTAEISGNTSGTAGSEKADNVYLQSGQTIGVTAALTDGASIGVTTSVVPTADAPVTVAVGSGYTVTSDDAAVFVSDAATRQTFYDATEGSEKVVLTVLRDIYVSSGGSDETGDGTPANPYATIATAYGVVPSGGTIHVMSDLDLSTNIVLGVSTTVAIVADKDGDLTDDDTATITRGSSNTSGAMLTVSAGDVTLQGVVFDGANVQVEEATKESATAGATGILVTGGTLTIGDGAGLTNSVNTSTKTATSGGVKVTQTGKVVLEPGGFINGNSGNSGGGVLAYSGGTFQMNGGTVADNQGKSGGGVYVFSGGVFTMDGGTISGNRAVNNGGGVYIYGVNGSYATVDLKSGTIKNNFSDYLFGGVGIAQYSTVTIGSVAIESNGISSESVTTLFFGAGVGLLYTTDDMISLTLTGAPKIRENYGNISFDPDNHTIIKTENAELNNLFLYNYEATIGSDGLSEGASIGVTTYPVPTVGSDVTVATNATETDAGYFFSDSAFYSAVYNSGAVVLSIGSNVYVSSDGDDTSGNGTPAKPYATIGKALEAATTAGLTDVTVHVMSDLTLSAATAISKDVTIVSDSDGDLTDGEQYTLTRSSDFTGINSSNTTLFQVTGGTAEFQNLTIDGNKDVTTVSYPAISVTSGATVTLSGKTTLTHHSIGGNNSDMSDKGVIYLNSGTLNIRDEASITGNTWVSSHDTDNRVIQVNSSGGNTVNMTGGSITNNKMKIAAMTVNSAMTLNVSGSAVISGNTDKSGAAADVYLNDGYTVTIAGELTDGASIGVTTKTTPTANKPVTVAAGASTGDEAYFFSDNSSYCVDYSDETVVLSVPANPEADAEYRVTGAKGSEITLDGVTYRENLTDGAFSSKDNWLGVNAADTLFSKVEIGTNLSTYGLTSMPDGTTSSTSENPVQFLELNGTSGTFPETIYQEVDVLPGSTVYISFWYIKRQDQSFSDMPQQMLLSVLPHEKTDGTTTYDIPTSGTFDRTTFVDGAITGDSIQLYKYKDSTGTGTYAQVESDAVTVTADSADTATENTYPANTVITAGTQWTKVVASYTVPSDVYSVYVAFHSVTPVGNGAGNILAMASVKTAQLEDAYVSHSGSDTTGGGTITAPFATLDKALEWVKAGGTIHVMDDLTLTAGLTIGKDVTIVADSDGDLTDDDAAKIIRGSDFTSGSMITVTGGELTLKDLTLDGGNITIGAVAGGGVHVNDGAALTAENCTFQNHQMKTASEGTYGAAVANAGKAVLESCVFQDNWVASSGSAVYNTGGEMDITGGTFTNNTCNASQGALFVKDGTVTVTETSFTGNQAAYAGPALYIIGGTVNLGDGVVITGNTLTSTNRSGGSGAVHVSGATLNLSGNVQIIGNTYGADSGKAGVSANLYVGNAANTTVTLTAALTDDASIGVTTETAPTAAAPVTVAMSGSGYTVTEADAARFFSDSTAYSTWLEGSGTDAKVVLGLRSDYYVSAQGNDTNGDGTPTNPYATIGAAYSAAKTAGVTAVTIHVMSDLTLTAALTAGINVTILSDDADDATEDHFTITRGSGFTSASMFTVNGGYALTLKDLTLDGGSVELSNSGGGVYVNTGAVLTATDCTFENHKITAGGKYGAAVYNAGTAEFTGCTFQNNSLPTTGPAIYSGESGALTVTDCTVTGNECTSSEGAISVDNGTATITGTTFTGNKGKYAGPALRVFGGTVTMEDVTVSNNTITGGTDWGAVYVLGDCADVTVTMRNVTITNNGIDENGTAATTACSGIYMAPVSGKTYSVTVNLSDSAITGNTGYGVNVISGATLNLFGDVQITDNVSGNLYLPSNVTAKLTAALSSTASIGVTTASTPATNSPVDVAVGSGYTVTADDAGRFFSDIADYQTFYDAATPSVILGIRQDYYVSAQGSDDSGDGTPEAPCATIEGAYNAANTAGVTAVTIHVMNDLTVTTRMHPEGTATKTITVVADSNGDLTDGEKVTIIRGFAKQYDDDNSLFYVSSGYTMTLRGLTLDGQNEIIAERGLGVFVKSGGTLTAENCVFLNHKATDSRNGIAVYSEGTTTLTNCEFKNNSTTGSGTVAIGGGTATITGCAFSENTNANGAVYLSSGTLTLSDSSVTGSSSYGVYVSSGATLNLSGDVQITDNASGNLYLPSNVTAKLTAALGDSASIGVTTATKPQVGSNVDVAVGSGYTVTADDAAKFFSDQDDYQTFYDTATTGSEKVVLGIRQDYYVSAQGSDETGTGTRKNPYATIAAALKAVPDGGTIYVMNDITIDVSTAIDNTKNVTITTDPEVLTTGGDGTVTGAAVVTASGTRSIRLQNGATLTLKDIVFQGSGSGAAAPFLLGSGGTDSSKSGKLVLESGAVIRNYSTNFGAVWASANSSNAITIKAGASITGNKNVGGDTGNQTGYGGAVTLLGGTLTIEGGEITGNTAVNGGGGVYAASGTTVNLSGAPVITGNTSGAEGSEKTDNVYLPSGVTLTVAGALSSTAKIGVTQVSAAAGTVFAKSGSNYAVTATDAAAFFDDIGKYGVAVSGSNLVWASVGTATVTELYSYAQGTSVTALFQVTYTGTPTSSYTVAVTGGSGGTAATQGGFFGGNYVVKVTGLTAGTAYTVSAVVDGTVCPGGLSWTAPDATYSSHGDSANTSGYWSSTNDPSYRTDADGTVTDEVVSGIAYRVLSDQKIDVQGYSQTRTTYANAGWTPLTVGSSLQVWASPSIVSGDSGADYVVLTYYVRNNSGTDQSGVWLGANADIMIGVNDKAPVYKENYGLRTAVSTDADALSFAIITQHSDEGVAANASTVSTLWFGYWKDRTANTFKNTTATSYTGKDSGAAFSWNIGTLAAGAVASKSVVIGVAGKDDQTKDITGPFETSGSEDGPDTSVTITEVQLDLTLTPVTEGIEVTVQAGQTYVLTDAAGDIVDTYEAAADGTYTFSGLLSTETYTVTTRKADEETVDENGNVTAITQYKEGTATAQPLARTQEYTGVIVLNEPTKDVSTLTYTFPDATAQIVDTDGNVASDGKFYNVSVMVDSGSFTLTQAALTALSGYAAVSGLNTSNSYVTSASAESKYTYLIFSFTEGVLASSVQSFLRALTFTVEGYGVAQTVEVDADVIELPGGVVRLGSSYYRYVAYKAITWSNAYKAAKNSAFNGLTGYLMTVDSALEHNFVYQAFGSVNGWMGGLRTTAAGGFDGGTYATSNPNKSGTWKWVCGPNAGTEFWKGWSSSTSNAVTGVYANWKSGEPNNSTYEYSAQYGFGTAGMWNDYKPTNSAIGGYFIEYTAYGDMTATSPMAHDDKTTEFGNGVIVSTGGVNGTTGYENVEQTLTKLKKGDGYNSTTQVLRLTSDITDSKAVTVEQDVYLDLNGHSDTIQAITLANGATLYGMDSATDGYNDAAAGKLVFQGNVTGQVATITTTTADQTSTAKRYVAVTSYDETENTTTVEFHRFNVWVTKLSGTYWYDTSTNQVSATLTYTMGVRGDSAAMGAITGLGADVNGETATEELDQYGISSTEPSNYSTYTATLISSENQATDYAQKFSVSAAVSFGEGENMTTYTSTPQTRSLLAVLKSYYNKATDAEKALIDKFITQAGLGDAWAALN